jgi:hypothetical protein
MNTEHQKPSTRGKRRGAKRSPPSAALRPDAMPSKPYEPTLRERASLEAFIERRSKTKPIPRLKITDKGEVHSVSLDHPDQVTGGRLLTEALGVPDSEAANGILSQIINAGTIGKRADESAANFMLALVAGIEPQDQIETMLAAQMAAVHNATMTFARRLNHTEHLAQQDSASNALNKLARTFAVQVEALNRHRGKGQQKVTVEHVTVNAGGQAIVGAISTSPGAGGQMKAEGQAHAKQDAIPQVTALPSPDPQRDAMPIAEGERPQALPDARRG